MKDFLHISCDEWRAVADAYPEQMAVIVDMMIEAEADLCDDMK